MGKHLWYLMNLWGIFISSSESFQKRKRIIWGQRMGRMLIIMILYTMSAKDPNVSTEIMNMDIHFVAAVHLLQLELSLVHV